MEMVLTKLRAKEVDIFITGISRKNKKVFW